ncbi:glutamine amidotransferase (plasmid) [Variovorax sp. PBL-H6]|uniref:FAD-binding oxidoreductase n=1 Tax=unclassified Variovorax TaxID=663243 RepID=UPI001317E915|nr:MULTISPECIES: FAD-binding oxidoreductase [unclassified Variovorax]VTU42784.1 glutamine amidotransferase [Variovorax sp. SRS16]VTU43764.1 glutamine amidotransferase [Variovorax sp. PBL-H6]
MKLAHSLTVTAVSPQGSDAILLSLGVDGGQRQRFSFQSGQYLTLAVPVQGDEHWRCYSITSAPEDGQAISVLGAALAQAPSVLVQSHGECVAALPPGSVLLASSQTIPHEVFLVQGRILGIQGHPEVDRQFLKDKFMAYHRALFDDEQWAHVEQEASQPLSPDAVIALGRRLLDEGALAPAAVPTLTETT